MSTSPDFDHLDRYKYEDLDNDNEFRTINILSVKKDGTLRCRLQRQPLPSRAQEHAPLIYDAISWYWGADESLKSVCIVHDTGKEEVLSVRPKLIEALKGLRDPENPNKVFWIDALCINQDRSHERDLQVQHMFEIYSYAQNVCIWLGDDENHSELALKFIEERVCDVGAFEKTTEDQNALEQWKALAALMNRPWFSRRWVVQELALAKTATVHCGGKFVHWADFETAVALFQRDAPKIAMQFRGSSSADYDPEFFGDVTNMRATRLVEAKSDLFRTSKGDIKEYRFTLSELVSNLSFFEAKEPHDLIYAILSLARDTHSGVRTVPEARAATPEPPSQETLNGANTFFAGPVSASPPTAHSSSSDQFFNQNQQDTNTKKRGSTVMIDDQRLTKKQKHNLLNNITHWKRTTRPENTRLFPPVNYQQRFFDLCKQFLNFAIPKMKFPNLDIICRPWAPEAPVKDQQKLPSWIPRASSSAFGVRVAEHAPGRSQVKRKNADPLVGQTTHHAPYYNASRSMNAKKDEWRFGDPEKDENELSLFVTGFVLDTIGTIEDASQNGHIPAEWIELGEWSPWAQKGGHDVKIQAPDELWRTLVADRGPEGGNTKVYYRKAFEYAVTHSTFDAGLQTTELKQRGNSILVELLTRMEAVVWNRRLFRSTMEHFLGLAPKQAKEGDYICIVRGISVPVVLRKARDSDEYTFIGECYVHTMMSGQALDIQERRLAEWKEEREKSGGTAMLVEERLMQTQMFELR